ncbi:hypothetical protein DXA58_00040 [Bacteroides uniformis]|nr:hypothetical protein DXA58_00040 [Bacteroides uniformis]RHD40434.1 hypothetical protein DW795_07255 [Bacteroides uniformis]RHJ77366.1 hypothetical protein DW104_01000 [Bacteroides uniformis]RHM79567.1 hypothetical protein DWZ42_01000 [Bacteroides uniformis]
MFQYIKTFCFYAIERDVLLMKQSVLLLETNCSVKGNTLFCQTKHATAPAFTFFRHIMKKAVTSQLLPHLERKHTFLSVMNYQKEFY